MSEFGRSCFAITNVIMLAVSLQLVCDQIEGADGAQSEHSKTRCSRTLVPW
jgi:hypothetical protein